jgi:hypothetical protein
MRMVCLALGALLLFQVVRALVQHDPLAHLTIPALPTLSAAGDVPSESKGTNAAPAPAKGGTNVASTAPNTKGTDAAHEQAPSKQPANDAVLSTTAKQTNSAAKSETATAGAVLGQTAVSPASNSAPLVALSSQTGHPTNRSPSVDGTNVAAQAATKGKPKGSPADLAAKNANAPRRADANKKAPDLPLPIQARVVKITETELLGPVMHPLPMALLGIAGDMAFLRSATGQTGLVKEGDELGGLKLLRIGINRVLVEQDGKKQELTIFSGLGGESLLPK